MSRLFMACLLLAVTALFSGCQETVPDKIASAPPPTETAPQVTESFAQEGQLYAEAETLEQAQELAQLYGIELVDYSYQIALFRTDEDPREVIRRGEENGWPELSLNGTMSAF